MAWFDLKSPRSRAIVIQVAIVAALIVFYKLALPKIQQAREASETAQREQRMMAFVHSVAVEVGGARDQTEEGSQSGFSETSERPQHLRVTPHVGDVEQELGAPQQFMNDLLGGQHLTWIGTRHKLVASFHKGRLYALTLTDLKTGHGMQIYESSAQWRAF